MQTCNKCKRELPDEKFGIRKDTKKLRRVCKECTSASVLKWRKDNPEKNNAIYVRSKNKYNDIETYCHRASAKKRNDERYTTTLTYTELLSIAIVTTHCPICGKPLDYSKGKKYGKHNSPSLDRKDNENIISKENVWIICNQCNMTKLNRTFDEFVKYCKMISEKF